MFGVFVKLLGGGLSCLWKELLGLEWRFVGTTSCFSRVVGFRILVYDLGFTTSRGGGGCGAYAGFILACLQGGYLGFRVRGLGLKI